VRTRWCRQEAFARGPLDDHEFLFVPYVRSRWNAAELPEVAAGYGLAFHGRGYVRDRWSRTFEIADVQERAITGWQDLVIARRRA
jgi:hypothetical protein